MIITPGSVDCFWVLTWFTHGFVISVLFICTGCFVLLTTKSLFRENCNFCDNTNIAEAFILCNNLLQVKWKEELKAKEEALVLVEEERRSKEAAESNNKRRIEALRLKIEIDFQRHKDDLLRLEQELSRLKASAQSAELHHQSSTSPTSNSEGTKPQRETIARLLQQLDNLDDFSDKEVNSNRECIICMKDEVSIVFLPCAHQVMCASCSDEYGRKGGKAACPCCRVQIQQRIRVFGASS